MSIRSNLKIECLTLHPLNEIKGSKAVSVISNRSYQQLKAQSAASLQEASTSTVLLTTAKESLRNLQPPKATFRPTQTKPPTPTEASTNLSGSRATAAAYVAKDLILYYTSYTLPEVSFWSCYGCFLSLSEPNIELC